MPYCSNSFSLFIEKDSEKYPLVMRNWIKEKITEDIRTAAKTPLMPHFKDTTSKMVKDVVTIRLATERMA